MKITDVNGNDTTYEYDTLKRLTKVYKPDDASVDIEYKYNLWGEEDYQNIETITVVNETDNISQRQYFDGLGRVIQVHSQGETGYTIISGTVAFVSGIMLVLFPNALVKFAEGVNRMVSAIDEMTMRLRVGIGISFILTCACLWFIAYYMKVIPVLRAL